MKTVIWAMGKIWFRAKTKDIGKTHELCTRFLGVYCQLWQKLYTLYLLLPLYRFLLVDKRKTCVYVCKCNLLKIVVKYKITLIKKINKFNKNPISLAFDMSLNLELQIHTVLVLLFIKSLTYSFTFNSLGFIHLQLLGIFQVLIFNVEREIYESFSFS